MPKIKQQDYSPTNSFKIYDIEVVEGEMIYKGTEIKARNKNHALQIMIFISDGVISKDSEILSFEESKIH